MILVQTQDKKNTISNVLRYQRIWNEKDHARKSYAIKNDTAGIISELAKTLALKKTTHRGFFSRIFFRFLW